MEAHRSLRRRILSKPNPWAVHSHEHPCTAKLTPCTLWLELGIAFSTLSTIDRVFFIDFVWIINLQRQKARTKPSIRIQSGDRVDSHNLFPKAQQTNHAHVQLALVLNCCIETCLPPEPASLLIDLHTSWRSDATSKNNTTARCRRSFKIPARLQATTALNERSMKHSCTSRLRCAHVSLLSHAPNDDGAQ